MLKWITAIAIILLIIGGINWGLIGIWGFNLIDYLFARTYIDRIIYCAIGLAGIYYLVGWRHGRGRRIDKR